jgi:hypothetical protein
MAYTFVWDNAPWQRLRSMNNPIVQIPMRERPTPADMRLTTGDFEQPHTVNSVRSALAHRNAMDVPDGAAAASIPMPADAGMPLAFLSRFIVLQAIGAAGLVGLWLGGIADKPFEGDSGFLCWLIVGIGVLGLLCVFMHRWRDVEWLATHVVRIGLLGTVVGLIVAFSAASAGGSADPSEIRPMIAAVVDGMYVSLYATLMGIAVNLWLKINLRLLGNVHG